MVDVVRCNYQASVALKQGVQGLREEMYSRREERNVSELGYVQSGCGRELVVWCEPTNTALGMLSSSGSLKPKLKAPQSLPLDP